MMQELNREANTLGSKSVDLEVTTVVAGAEALIEQMREQIQNIEIGTRDQDEPQRSLHRRRLAAPVSHVAHA